jgi:hypothetical protein
MEWGVSFPLPPMYVEYNIFVPDALYLVIPTSIGNVPVPELKLTS